MLILDEFPTESLLGADGKIDAARYPNFARLASIATWFKLHHGPRLDPGAVPAILDARPPYQAASVPTYGTIHAASTTLFGERGTASSTRGGHGGLPARYCRGANARPARDPPQVNAGRPKRLRIRSSPASGQL